jgi:hypothetical protein
VIEDGVDFQLLRRWAARSRSLPCGARATQPVRKKIRDMLHRKRRLRRQSKHLRMRPFTAAGAGSREKRGSAPSTSTGLEKRIPRPDPDVLPSCPR